MKFIVIIPPFITLPAKGHGGTERIAQGMIDEFLELGHEVTLLGAGKCQTKANYIPIFSRTISEQKFDSVFLEQSRPLRMETAYITKVMKYLQDHDGEFDVTFNHLRGSYLLLPLAKFLKTPIISILHLPLFEELIDVLSLFENPNLISISDSQRKSAFGRIKFLATIHNGIDLKEFSFNENPKDYFLFMGAMGEHKSPHLAIEACKQANVKLILAGGKIREPYFSKEIRPQLDDKQIKYVGEVTDKERINLFSQAKGFLMPVTWEEPFGLVMIEAMACGTPVIGFNRGAIPEVIEENKTGFIVENVNQMAEAITKIDSVKRIDCRKYIEKKFTYQKMVKEYLEIARKLTGARND